MAPFPLGGDRVALSPPLDGGIGPSHDQANAGHGRVAMQIVGHRPNRIEPRAVKRRPQPLALLTKPRAEARADLLRRKAPPLFHVEPLQV
jgi:hypothetical protein